MTDQQSTPTPAPTVLVGNEAGRYLAKRLREMVGEVGNNTTFTEHLLRVADDLAEKGAGSDEQLAYEKGLAEGAALLRATQEQLARALNIADEAIDSIEYEVSLSGYTGDYKEVKREIADFRAQTAEIKAWQGAQAEAASPQIPSPPDPATQGPSRPRRV